MQTSYGIKITSNYPRDRPFVCCLNYFCPQFFSNCLVHRYLDGTQDSPVAMVLNSLEIECKPELWWVAEMVFGFHNVQTPPDGPSTSIETPSHWQFPPKNLSINSLEYYILSCTNRDRRWGGSSIPLRRLGGSLISLSPPVIINRKSIFLNSLVPPSSLYYWLDSFNQVDLLITTKSRNKLF